MTCTGVARPESPLFRCTECLNHFHHGCAPLWIHELQGCGIFRFAVESELVPVICIYCQKGDSNSPLRKKMFQAYQHYMHMYHRTAEQFDLLHVQQEPYLIHAISKFLSATPEEIASHWQTELFKEEDLLPDDEHKLGIQKLGLLDYLYQTASLFSDPCWEEVLLDALPFAMKAVSKLEYLCRFHCYNRKSYSVKEVKSCKSHLLSIVTINLCKWTDWRGTVHYDLLEQKKSEKDERMCLHSEDELEVMVKDPILRRAEVQS